MPMLRSWTVRLLAMGLFFGAFTLTVGCSNQPSTEVVEQKEETKRRNDEMQKAMLKSMQGSQKSGQKSK